MAPGSAPGIGGRVRFKFKALVQVVSFIVYASLCLDILVSMAKSSLN